MGKCANHPEEVDKAMTTYGTTSKKAYSAPKMAVRKLEDIKVLVNEALDGQESGADKIELLQMQQDLERLANGKKA